MNKSNNKIVDPQIDNQENLDDIKKSIIDSENPEGEDGPKKKKEKLNYVSMLKFYYLPILFIAIFFVLLIFGLVPSIDDLFDHFGKKSDLQDEIKRSDETIDVLTNLKNNSFKTEQYLESINRIAPVEETNVTEFQTNIRNIAKSSGLEVETTKTSEAIIAVQDEDLFTLIEVPTEFDIVGSFDNVKDFLQAIYKSDDFIIIREMTLSKTLEGNSWNLNTTLVKYQFVLSEEGQNRSIVTSYSNVPEMAVPDKTVIKFLEDKYINTKED